MGSCIEKTVAFYIPHKPRTAQATIPYEAIYPDGVCRIDRRTFSKCIAFEDISYQLAQPETRTAIFEHLCDLYNYVEDADEEPAEIEIHSEDGQEDET